MTYSILQWRAKIALALLTVPTFSAGQPSMPNSAAIAREAAKQAPRSAAAINKAEQQAKLLRQPVLDVSAAGVLPPIDPAAIAKRYENLRPTDEAALFVMVSFSMPPQSIERLAAQANKAGATLVLRGMVDDSLTKTAAVVEGFLKRHPGAQFQIDPTVFKRFAVDQVPTFVLSSQTSESGACAGKECNPSNSFVSVSGDVTLDYALEYLAKQRNERFSQLAERRLKRVRGAL